MVAVAEAGVGSDLAKFARETNNLRNSIERLFGAHKSVAPPPPAKKTFEQLLEDDDEPRGGGGGKKKKYYN